MTFLVLDSLTKRFGDQIVLQLHLLNASQSPVTSTAAVDVALLEPSMVKDDAEMILAGPFPDSTVTPSIPTGTSTVSRACTMTGATNFYAVFPHMHKIGKHITVQAIVGGQTQPIYDADYDFNNQVFKSFAPIALAQGDQIAVTCTYANNTGAPVKFGSSSNKEMCFAISFRYPILPAGDNGPFCTK